MLCAESSSVSVHSALLYPSLLNSDPALAGRLCASSTRSTQPSCTQHGIAPYSRATHARERSHTSSMCASQIHAMTVCSTGDWLAVAGQAHLLVLHRAARRWQPIVVTVRSAIPSLATVHSSATSVGLAIHASNAVRSETTCVHSLTLCYASCRGGRI